MNLIKDNIIAKARAATLQHLGESAERLHAGGLCFYLSYFVYAELRKVGISAIPQAGSARWQFRHNDSTSGPTCAAYEWTPLGPVIGNLPEVHIWCAIPETNTIIDASLEGFRSIAKAIGDDFIHPGYELPDYLWSAVDAVPANCAYYPEADACWFVAYLMLKEFKCKT